MQKLLIATTNKSKIQEFSDFLTDIPVVSLADIGINVDVEETGTTYEENAVLKATFYSKLSGLFALSDDGGLEIDALDGAPGLHSRRWIGKDATHEELFDHFLAVVKELPEDTRGATFRCVIAFATPDGSVQTVENHIRGELRYNPSVLLQGGYPYRRCFWIPELGKFYDELTKHELVNYNHRLKAVEKLKPIMKEKLGLV